MDPRKRRRIDEEMARWRATDPTMRRLRERIDFYRAQREEKERRERGAGSGDRSE
jgi:hypothetical protein